MVLAGGDAWGKIRVEEARASGAGDRPEGSLPCHLVVVSAGGPARAELSWIGEPPTHEQVVEPGHFTFLPAAMPCASRWRDGWTAIMVEMAPGTLAELAGAGDPGERPRLRPVFNRADPFVAHLAEALRDLARDGNSSGMLYGETLGMALAEHLLKRYSPAAARSVAPRGGLPTGRMRRVAEYVAAHLEGEISLRDLALQAEMSVFHFARMFKQGTGVPPHQYVLRRRIERARALLADLELPIGDVAVRCGFAHPSHFSDSFHRLQGVTPTEYRRSIRQ
jgi:AraC family transcriptional regulator